MTTTLDDLTRGESFRRNASGKELQFAKHCFMLRIELWVAKEINGFMPLRNICERLACSIHTLTDDPVSLTYQMIDHALQDSVHWDKIADAMCDTWGDDHDEFYNQWFARKKYSPTIRQSLYNTTAFTNLSAIELFAVSPSMQKGYRWRENIKQIDLDYFNPDTFNQDNALAMYWDFIDAVCDEDRSKHMARITKQEVYDFLEETIKRDNVDYCKPSHKERLL